MCLSALQTALGGGNWQFDHKTTETVSVKLYQQVSEIQVQKGTDGVYQCCVLYYRIYDYCCINYSMKCRTV